MKSNTVIYKWHRLTKIELTPENLAEYKSAYISEIAAQFRRGQMIQAIDFAGSGVFFQPGFSTDLGESCSWITPFVLEPDEPLTLT